MSGRGPGLGRGVSNDHLRRLAKTIGPLPLYEDGPAVKLDW